MAITENDNYVLYFDTKLYIYNEKDTFELVVEKDSINMYYNIELSHKEIDVLLDDNRLSFLFVINGKKYVIDNSSIDDDVRVLSFKNLNFISLSIDDYCYYLPFLGKKFEYSLAYGHCTYRTNIK
jgi:hypothetical protein